LALAAAAVAAVVATATAVVATCARPRDQGPLRLLLVAAQRRVQELAQPPWWVPMAGLGLAAQRAQVQLQRRPAQLVPPQLGLGPGPQLLPVPQLLAPQLLLLIPQLLWPLQPHYWFLVARQHRQARQHHPLLPPVATAATAARKSVAAAALDCSVRHHRRCQ